MKPFREQVKIGYELAQVCWHFSKTAQTFFSLRKWRVISWRKQTGRWASEIECGERSQWSTSSTGRRRRARCRAESLGGLVRTDYWASRVYFSGSMRRVREFACWSASQLMRTLLIHGPHRAQRVVILTSLIDLSGKTENKINQGKRHMWQSLEGTRLQLQEFSPGGIPQHMLNSCSSKLWRHVSSACRPGNLTETQHPGCWLSTGHTDNLCPTRTGIPDFQEETRRVPWLIWFAHTLGRVSPSSQFREWWGDSQIRVPRCVCKEAFPLRAVSGPLS